MLIDFLSLLVGVWVSYKIVSLAFRKIRFEKLVNVVFGVYVSLVTVAGFAVDYFRLPLSYLVIVFLGLGVLLLFFSMRRTGAAIIYDKKNLCLAALLFVVAFLIYLYPTLPSLSPTCYAGDCETHYVYVQYIYDKDVLEHGINYGYADLRDYPFGLHINAGLLARALDVPPILLTQPLLVLLTVLTILSAYGLASDLLNNRRTALFVPVLLLISIFPASILSIGFWAQVMGIYLVMLFIWVLLDYRETKDVGILAVLILLELAAYFSYNTIAALPIAAFLAAAVKLKGKWIHRIGHVLFFSLVVGSAGLLYVNSMAHEVGIDKDPLSTVPAFLNYQAQNHLIHDGITTRGDMESLGYYLIILASVGAVYSAYIFLKDRNAGIHGPPLFFFIALLVQMAAMAYALQKGLEPYWFYKNFFLLIYPLAIYAAIALDFFARKLYRSNIGRKWKHALFFLFLVLLFLFMNYKTSNPQWTSKEYGPLDSFSCTYLNKDFPSYLVEDSLRFNRTGDIPALYDAARWIKEHRNCSREPCPGEIYYTGPYDAYWLYGMSRYRILVEANQDGSPMPNIGPSIPADDVLYHKDGIYLYKNATRPGSKILQVYQLSLDNIK